MTVRFRKVRKVVIVPILSVTICHNKWCRKRLNGPMKYVCGLKPGYKSPICIRCYMLIVKSGFEFEGVVHKL